MECTMRFYPEKNDFYMDFENWCLEHRWDSRQGIPKGPTRCEQPQWAAMMKRECEDSDMDFDEYCAWVQHGGGDEWFWDEAQCAARGL